MAGMERQRHLTVFGATSFVGQILTRYLYARFGTDGDLRWAIAGRSERKLRELHGSLYPKATQLPVVVADAGNEQLLRQLCSESQVVVSTVGPYALYGEPLVKICASTGTDYCDLAGEVQWIRRMIRKYEGAARTSGARIVHCCGFDSIPSDLGVHYLQKQAMQKYGKTCSRVKLRVKAVRGGPSGGTIASILNLVKEASADPQLRRELANPYSLCPEGYAPPLVQYQVSRAEYDPDFKSWVSPFVMAAINTRIVQRTNALSNQAYGADFRYDEAVLSGDGFKGRTRAMGTSAGLGAFMTAAGAAPTRWVLERFLPAPGEGPSAEEQRNGFFDLRLLGKTADDRAVQVKVTGDRDPGYGSTGKMLGQAAACLALDTPRTKTPGGFWTPATIFGDRLIDRLTRYSGLRFEVA
jgi:short subunit dehydrogenase-like uncharacterized protein